MAVKITFSLLHIVVADADIVTPGTTALLTVTLMLLLMAVIGFAHGNELVITTFTTLPFVSDDVEKTGLLVPELTPFTCHW